MLDKKCFVLDLDGTVYLGDIPIPGTVDFILRHRDAIDFYFLSNNTSKAPATYIRKLERAFRPRSITSSRPSRRSSPTCGRRASARSIPSATVILWPACASGCRN